jgi:hypothetical protein
MVEFALLLKRLSTEIYQPSSDSSWSKRSSKSLELDQRLVEWKCRLPQNLNVDKSSMSEPEWVAKQKIVLKLRKYSVVESNEYNR